MEHGTGNSQAKDKLLFTPGPLTTSMSVKQAVLRDLGSRDVEFIQVVRDVRRTLLSLAGVREGEYEAVLIQGSGTFAVEATLTSTIPRDGKVLVVINGAYGHRMVKICKVAGAAFTALECEECRTPDPERIVSAIEADPEITHVAVVHCETTTGIVNPIREIGTAVKSAGRVFIVDAMSSFGAVPLNMAECGVDYLVSSANKCIEGIPGFAFVLAKHDTFMKTEGCSRSLALDLYDQWKGLESNGQFRFTPPTHAILAFHQALRELADEGGVAGRAERYRRNYEALLDGMRALGFEEYLPSELQGYIITSFRYPEHPKWDFERFYHLLNGRDFVIYPGKVSNAECFRIGTIGRIGENDIRDLLSAMGSVLKEMDITLK